MAGKKKSGSPLAIIAPLAIVAGAAFVVIQYLKGQEQKGADKGSEEESTGPSPGTVTIPETQAADVQGSPSGGDFHDAPPDLAEESPRVPSGQVPRTPNGVEAAASDDDHEFAEAETGASEEGSEEDADAKAKLDALMQRAQGTSEKLQKLVEENVPKS